MEMSIYLLSPFNSDLSHSGLNEVPADTFVKLKDLLKVL